MTSKEFIRENLSYDSSTGKLTWLISRPGVTIGSIAGCEKKGRGGKTYRWIGIGGAVIVAHHIAWLLMTGDWPQDQIDHEDGDGTNNKWNNLREVDRPTNSKNLKKARNNTSGVTGVVKRSSTNWIVQLGVGGKRKHIGSFRSLSEAIIARDAAYKEHGFHPNHGSEKQC